MIYSEFIYRNREGSFLWLSGICLTAAAVLGAYLYFLWNKPGKYLK